MKKQQPGRAMKNTLAANNPKGCLRKLMKEMAPAKPKKGKK